MYLRCARTFFHHLDDLVEHVLVKIGERSFQDLALVALLGLGITIHLVPFEQALLPLIIALEVGQMLDSRRIESIKPILLISCIRWLFLLHSLLEELLQSELFLCREVARDLVDQSHRYHHLDVLQRFVGHLV